jgi:membrane protein implicated in regulation of membrane protease activity
MTTLLLTCLAVGGVVLVAQLVLALVGIGEHGGDAHASGEFSAKELFLGAHDASHVGSDVAAGLHLFSVRSIAAAVAFFGVGGLAARALGAPPAAVLLAALVAGVAASLATAAAMRALLRLDRDATVRLSGAVGAPATVYVPIPAASGGVGKVLLTLQGRTVECQALTAAPDSLPTGTRVVVVDVRAADLVEVVPTPDGDL